MKTKILNYLKNHPKTPSGKMVALLGINYYTLLKILDEMERDNLVKKIEETNATYWSVKE